MKSNERRKKSMNEWTIEWTKKDMNKWRNDMK